MRALLHTLLARIHGFLRPGAVAAEVDQELDSYLAIAEDEKVRSGMTRADARRAARLELGGVASSTCIRTSPEHRSPSTRATAWSR